MFFATLCRRASLLIGISGLLALRPAASAHAQAARTTVHAAPTAKAAPAATSAATLRLDGLNGKTRTLSAADLAALPRQEVRATGHDGQAHTYQGVALTDIMALVGGPQDKAIHGEVLAQALVAEAADGYRVVYALPELDAAFASQTVILATTRDGQPLPADAGPYQIIVPQEKRPARWMRQVQRLRLIRIPA